MKAPLSERCRDRWRNLLPLLGFSPKQLDGKHGPCPMCEGTDRFRFDNKEGTGSFYCSHCGAGDGVKLVMLKHGWDFKTAAVEIERHLADAPPSKRPASISPDDAHALNARLWKASRPIGEDMAAAYLIGRGFPAPWPDVLRFAPLCPVKGHPTARHMPALIAKVDGPDGKGATIHRTFLEKGQKATSVEARQLMPGTIPKGSAIRLGPVAEILGIAEGLETALAVTRDHGIVCWSAINATMLGEFIVPNEVRQLHIFGDNDPKFGGQAAAYKLAHAVATRRGGVEVVPRMPSEPGLDWDDIGRRLRVAA